MWNSGSTIAAEFLRARAENEIGPDEAKMNRMAIRRLMIFLAFAGVMLLARPAMAQDWFKTGTGLGVEKARVAVPEFAARDAQAQPLEKVFHDTLVGDLNYSGILELVSPSFYPTAVPSAPSDLKAADWSAAPASAYMVAYGNLSTSGGGLAVSGWLSDVRNAGTPPALSKIYRGQPAEEDARTLAHQFADAIIGLLSGGGPGIASTRIAFITNRSGHKEVWVMDYDGENSHQLSHLGSTSLTPRWSPDDSKIAFTCYVPFHGFTSVQICMLSLDTGGMLAFERYTGTNSSPAWSPDGGKLAFMSSAQGNPNIVITGPSGGQMHRITYSKSVDTSPVWNPKTGQQIVFVSDRGGLPALYQMNADGSDVQKIDTADKGYVIDPAWSPNGQLLAFSWRRPDGNYDIYAMDMGSHALVQLTRDAARNERPSWAPDGRHIVFESTRTGSRQIWTMLADGSNPRQITSGPGESESPNWSPR
jgi:TolB protein